MNDAFTTEIVVCPAAVAAETPTTQACDVSVSRTFVVEKRALGTVLAADTLTTLVSAWALTRELLHHSRWIDTSEISMVELIANWTSTSARIKVELWE